MEVRSFKNLQILPSLEQTRVESSLKGVVLQRSRGLLTLAIILCLALLPEAGKAQQCPIIPLPASAKAIKANFILSSKTQVKATSAEAMELANFFRNEVLRSTGITLSATNNAATNSVSLNLTSARKYNNAEAYSLKMDSKSVLIEAANKEGLFRGITSFLQLLRLNPVKDNSVMLNCWTVEDEPAFAWRGLMLDESRHFFGKDKVKSIIDWMAFYKLNRFHWHLTDQSGWRIEIKKYPRLSLVGGIGNHSNPAAPATYYTQNDIREIVKYAAERFIEVIPEIDMPGHATAANMAYPEFSGGGSEKYPNFTFNPASTPAYTYLTNILKEVNVLFPSGMIHLGGDEVHFGNQQWNTNPAVQSLMKENSLGDLKAVENYFIRRMADSVFSLNSKVLAWDEIAGANLPKDKTLVFWWRHDKPEELTKALDKGYKTVICPRLPLYFDFVQDSSHAVGRKWQGAFNPIEKVYNYAPLQQLPARQQNQVEGIQGNLWTEYVSTEQNLDFLLFPRICALAEAAWNKPGQRDYALFQDRLKKQMPLFRQAGLYYYDPFQPAQTPEYNGKGKKAQPGL